MFSVRYHEFFVLLLKALLKRPVHVPYRLLKACDRLLHLLHTSELLWLAVVFSWQFLNVAVLHGDIQIQVLLGIFDSSLVKSVVEGFITRAFLTWLFNYFLIACHISNYILIRNKKFFKLNKQQLRYFMF